MIRNRSNGSSKRKTANEPMFRSFVNAAGLRRAARQLRSIEILARLNHKAISAAAGRSSRKLCRNGKISSGIQTGRMPFNGGVLYWQRENYWRTMLVLPFGGRVGRRWLAIFARL